MDSAHVKWISLLVLVIQTTTLVLFLRFTMTRALPGERYVKSTVIALGEIVKLITCLALLIANHGLTGAMNEIYTECILRKSDALKMGIPAMLYVVQNNLIFYAISKLDAATYQVTYQLKLLTTAFFSVSMLNKKLNRIKWIAIILLTIGVALVQWPSDNNGKGKAGGESQIGDYDRLLGMFAVIGACMSSGFAGVYFEKILKGTKVSLWMRNVQLAFFSIFGAFLMIGIYDWSKIETGGFFQGYNTYVWIVVMLHSFGGLLIAMVVKYADNILKGFAVSVSIILSSILSYWLLNDFTPTLTFVIGALAVVTSTFLYGYEPKVMQYKLIQNE